MANAKPTNWIDAGAVGYSVNLHVPRRNNFWIYEWREFRASVCAADWISLPIGSPLDESGVPSEKFAAFRDVIAKRRTGEQFPALPQAIPRIEIPDITLGEVSPLWANLGTAVETQTPRPMETFGQSYGYILFTANAWKGRRVVS